MEMVFVQVISCFILFVLLRMQPSGHLGARCYSHRSLPPLWRLSPAAPISSGSSSFPSASFYTPAGQVRNQVDLFGPYNHGSPVHTEPPALLARILFTVVDWITYCLKIFSRSRQQSRPSESPSSWSTPNPATPISPYHTPYYSPYHSPQHQSYPPRTPQTPYIDGVCVLLSIK